jgi:hypothetical protein
MNTKEILLGALSHYGIQVIAVSDSHVKIQNNLEVEVEQNGMYKLYDDGYVVAPFGDVNALCRFILSEFISNK